MIGVYKIINTENNKCYIGSSVRINRRWNSHRKDLRKNQHHSIILQRAWNKYGEDKFIFEVLEETTSDNLLEREQFYLESLEPVYNILSNAGNSLGRVHSDETKAKISAYNKANSIGVPKWSTDRQKKPVLKLDVRTSEVLEEHESLVKALESVGKDKRYTQVIQHVCNGKRKSAYGFKWQWKNK